MRHKRVVFWCASLLLLTYWYINRPTEFDKEPRSRKTEVHSSNDHTKYVTSPSKPLDEWLLRRKALLKSPARRLKVLLFSYVRGGSSIAGEMFNRDPRATLWYEPLDSFYSAYYGFPKEMLPLNIIYHTNGTRRSLPGEEKQALTEFMENQFTCNYRKLPPEALSHYFLNQSAALTPYYKCMGNMSHTEVEIQSRYDACKHILTGVCGRHIDDASLNNCHSYIRVANQIIMQSEEAITSPTKLTAEILKNLGSSSTTVDLFSQHALCMHSILVDLVRPCLHIAEESCKNSSIHAIEANRLKMEDVEELMMKVPDVNVVYFLRDPRATINSRLHTNKLTWNATDKRHVVEARIFCPRINEDWFRFLRLRSKYGEALQLVRYDELVGNPARVADKMFSHFASNMSSSSDWDEFVRKAMHSPKGSTGGGYGTEVRDARKVASKWKTETPKWQHTELRRLCSMVIKEAGYE